MRCSYSTSPKCSRCAGPRRRPGSQIEAGARLGVPAAAPASRSLRPSSIARTALQVATKKHGDLEAIEEERHKRTEAKLARRVQRKKEEQDLERREQQQEERVRQLAEQEQERRLQVEQQQQVKKVSVLDEATGRYQEVYTVGDTEVDVEEL